MQGIQFGEEDAAVFRKAVESCDVSYVRHVDRARKEAEMWAWLGCFPGTETASLDQCIGCSG